MLRGFTFSAVCVCAQRGFSAVCVCGCVHSGCVYSGCCAVRCRAQAPGPAPAPDPAAGARAAHAMADAERHAAPAMTPACSRRRGAGRRARARAPPRRESRPTPVRFEPRAPLLCPRPCVSVVCRRVPCACAAMSRLHACVPCLGVTACVAWSVRCSYIEHRGRKRLISPFKHDTYLSIFLARQGNATRDMRCHTFQSFRRVLSEASSCMIRCA